MNTTENVMTENQEETVQAVDETNQNETPLYLELLVDGELYKPVKDFPNYFVSSGGKVYCLKGRKMINFYYLPTGHQMIRMHKSASKPKNTYVHRVVAQAWVPNPDNRPIIHHKDGNIVNNKSENLEWVTAEEHKEYMKNIRKRVAEKQKPVCYNGVVYDNIDKMAEMLNVTSRTAYMWKAKGLVTVV